MAWLSRLFRRRGEANAQRMIDQLRADLAREREAGGRLAEALSDARMGALMTQLAGPVAQALTQIHLLDAGRPIDARDALAVSGRLAAALADAGLVADTVPGAVVGYDPSIHDALPAPEPISIGAPVVIRQPGMRYGGRVLRRGLVERSAAP